MSAATAFGYSRAQIVHACLAVAFAMGLFPLLRAADAPKQQFNVAAGAAEPSIKVFSAQSGRQVIAPTDLLQGVRTQAAIGNFTAREALERMLSSTGLAARFDNATGAFAIVRSVSPIGPAPSGEARTQTAPTGPNAATRGANGDGRVVLTPFTVNAEKDVGFVAASSLAGGRIATALKDTPVAYSVVTAEFLEAFNLTDTTEAAQWTVNSYVNDGDNTGRMFGNTGSSAIRTRGSGAGTPTRNFFPFFSTPDSYILDRVDFARGPNAVLFGAGGIGGTVNSVTKQAHFSGNTQEARLQVGSYNRIRFSADVNQLVNQNVAVRANVVWDQSDTWRVNEWKERWGVHLASTYKITPKLSIRGEAELAERKEAISTIALRDRFSAWDGTTTFASIPATNLTAAQMAQAGLTRQPMRWVTNQDFGGFLNFQNRHITKAAQHNANINNTNRLNGVPIRTVGLNLTNAAIIDNDFVNADERFARALNNSQFRIPSRDFTTLWDNKIPTLSEKNRDVALYLNYTLGQNLFFEIAGNVNRSDIIGNTGLRRGVTDVYIDIDSVLPNGAPNPNFKKPYTEFMEYRNVRDHEQESIRAQAVYIKDTRFGKLQLSGMVGSNSQVIKARARTLLMPLTSIAPDARSWVDNDEYSQFGVYTRFYLDQKNKTYSDNFSQPVTLVNPINGITETVTPTWMYDTRREDNNRDSLREYQFLQTAGNLDLFKNRLILIGAFRRDFAKVADKRVLSPGDMPAGWDGTTLTFRKDAPADYFGLTYFPKNAAGVITGPEIPANNRPRSNVLGANIPQPQYANDVFQDDFDSPELTPIINTFTLGGVVNLTRWLGVYGNVSETFNLTSPQQRADGTLVPPTTSRGTDYGFRITLPNGRMALSVGQYDSYQEGASVLNPGGFSGQYNAISAAPVVGDLSPAGRNNRNVRAFPQNVYSTATDDAKGYEFELTANFTPAWRLVVNAGYTDAQRRDQSPDLIEYFKTQDAVTRQILADAGAIIGPDNIAFINPALDDPTLINQPRVNSAVNAWNNLQQNIIPNISAQLPVRRNGTGKWVGNIATDYRFRYGPLKGLRIGGGVNYRGGQVVGNRGNDTIRDPNNPAVAIDDPTVDASTPLYAPSYYKAIASLSYTFKLRDSRTLQLDFNIDNLFDYRKPVYLNGGLGNQSETYSAPRIGEDISSPARRTVPGQYTYLTPRNFSISAKLNF